MADQVEQDHAVATGGESLGDAPVELRVDQQPVHVDEDPSALAVLVVDETTPAEGERRRAERRGHGVPSEIAALQAHAPACGPGRPRPKVPAIPGLPSSSPVPAG
jgi:hypothetical protein